MDRSNTSTSIQGGDVAPLPVAVIVGASSKYDKDGKVKDFPATSRWYVFFRFYIKRYARNHRFLNTGDSEVPSL